MEQEDVIVGFLSGRDVFAVLLTGFGKTLLCVSSFKNLAIKKKLFRLLVEMFLLSVTLGIPFPQPTHTMASCMM